MHYFHFKKNEKGIGGTSIFKQLYLSGQARWLIKMIVLFRFLSIPLIEKGFYFAQKSRFMFVNRSKSIKLFNRKQYRVKSPAARKEAK